MTPKLRNVNGAELIKRLARIGFKHTSTVGSHATCILEQGGKFKVYVPLHHAVAIGTLHNILRRVASRLEISTEKLIEMLGL